MVTVRDGRRAPEPGGHLVFHTVGILADSGARLYCAIMSISVLLALVTALNAAPQAISPGPEDGFCVSGFCAGPVQNRMPGGLMYLAIGLVWLGVAGLRRERRRGGGASGGVAG